MYGPAEVLTESSLGMSSSISFIKARLGLTAVASQSSASLTGWKIDKNRKGEKKHYRPAGVLEK